MRYLLTVMFAFLISLINAQNPQGFFLDGWQPKTAISPAYVNTAQPDEPATVTITVNMNDTLTKVCQYVFGNNAINWAGKMNTNTSIIKDVGNLNPHVLRWPGGSESDVHFWDAVQYQGPTDVPPTITIAPLNAGMNTTNWAMTTDEYYDFLAKTHTTGCICVNYAYARYGTGPDPVSNAAHYAANWVRYDNGRTKYWEIGNEEYGSWEAGYEIDTTLNQDGQPRIISGELYGKQCRVFIDSMKSAAGEIGSDIKIGVVVEEQNITYDNVMNKWNSGVMPQIADKADFLIVHSYYTPYNQNSSVTTILNSAASTKSYKDYVLKDLKTYGYKNSLPVALTEWNIFAVGSMQQVSFINGMHAALVLGELIKNQYGEATRWDLANGWSDGNDHGLFARSDEPGVTVNTPHAPFYYMYYFQKYFGDYMVGSSVSGSGSMVSYASSFSSGQSGVVIVNKGTTQQIVNLNMDNITNARSYYRYVLTGGTDNGSFSRKVYVNGEGPAGDGGGPKNYDTVKAFGTSINGDIKFAAPPLSVTYVLVTGDSVPNITGIKTIQNPSLKIYPNPAHGKVSIINPWVDLYKIDIVNLNGEKVFEKVFTQPSYGSIQLNFNLDSGVYILNAYHKNQKISAKLIVR